MEHEIEIDGVKHKVDIDLAALKAVSNEKADQIRKESYQSGFDKRGEELTTATARITALETEIASKTKTSTTSTEEINTLRTELKEITSTLKQQSVATAEAQYASQLSDHAAKLNLIEDGAGVFADFARKTNVKMEDGTVQYRLPEGGIGSLDDLSTQWSKSPVGKSLTNSDQKGGGGSQPPTGLPPSAKFDTQEAREAYAKEYGNAAFLTEMQRQKALPKAS